MVESLQLTKQKHNPRVLGAGCTPSGEEFFQRGFGFGPQPFEVARIDFVLTVDIGRVRSQFLLAIPCCACFCGGKRCRLDGSSL